MSLSAKRVDPRDVGMEESEPTYRVYFWSTDGKYCRTFDLTDVEAVELAVAWADAEVAPNETYILGIRYQESAHRSAGNEPAVVFVRLKGNPPPGQSIGDRRG